MAYAKEERWEQKFRSGDEVKTYYPRSEEQRDRNFAAAKARGWARVSCKKLYPFSTYKNQHNFELIHNIVMNELYDIWIGDKKADDAEIDRLEKLRDESEKFFCLPLPMAWLPWEEWKAAKEMAENAIVHRQNACIEAGRYDLVAYC